jgi:diguanylate cyclase (GGDEF)-like protein
VDAKRGTGDGGDSTQAARVAALEAENLALKRALRLLADVANLARAAEEPEATAYAILTGVTAGVGLGLNRAMLFECGDEPGVLVGRAAIGPDTREEADRIWRLIAAAAPDLETLYEAGLRHRGAQSALDAHVRRTTVRLAAAPTSPLALAAERLVVAEGEDNLQGLLHPSTTIAAPMRGREGLRGVLLADNRFTGRAPDAVVRLVFPMLADHAARALFSADRWAEVAKEARTDALTGLDSRRAGLALLEHTVTGALASGGAVSLVLVDLDHFKRVNDTLGHPVGDLVLVTAAQRVRGALSRGERAFRYGGEELGVVLDGQDLETAVVVAERIRQAVAAAPVTLQDGTALPLTASVGVASSPPVPPDARLLLDAADQALLRAKRLGRNRVERA